MICFWSCSFLAHEARGGHFRHRFEVPKSIDFGVQKGIHFGYIFIKNTYVFNMFLYLNWGPFLGPFFGAIIFWWGVPKVHGMHTRMQSSDFFLGWVGPFLRSENWPILVPLKWVPKLSILEFFRSPFLGPFFGTLFFWRVHLLSSNTTIWEWESQKMDPKMDPKMVPFWGPF